LNGDAASEPTGHTAGGVLAHDARAIYTVGAANDANIVAACFAHDAGSNAADAAAVDSHATWLGGNADDAALRSHPE
jgi:hypothetical protein